MKFTDLSEADPPEAKTLGWIACNAVAGPGEWVANTLGITHALWESAARAVADRNERKIMRTSTTTVMVFLERDVEDVALIDELHKAFTRLGGVTLQNAREFPQLLALKQLLRDNRKTGEQ